MSGLFLALLACGASSGVRSEDTATLAAGLAAGTVPLLIDVRSPAEFASGHIAAARNIPIGELDQHLGELELFKDGEIHVICQSGGRSRAASEQLAAKGFTPIDVKGGMSAWDGDVAR